MDNKEPARAGLLDVVIRNTLATRVLGCTLVAVGGVVFSGDPEVVRSTERTECRGQGHETGSRGKGVRTLAWSWSTTDGSVTCSLQDLKNTPITISIRRNYTRARTTMKWLVFTRMRHDRQDIDRADVYGHRDHPQHISSTSSCFVSVSCCSFTPHTPLFHWMTYFVTNLARLSITLFLIFISSELGRSEKI